MDDIPMPKDFWNYPYNPITGWYVPGHTSNSKHKLKYKELIKNKKR